MSGEREKMREHVRAALPVQVLTGLITPQESCTSVSDRRPEGADMAILIPAALFHDIARPNEERTGIPHEEAGARMAETYLRSIHYPENQIPGIIHAIRAHRYRSGISPETLEARVLSDADNLDAMGAVGIARTLLQAGEQGSGIPDAVDHIRTKLLNLKARMYTETARRIAEERHAFLTTFLEELNNEMHPQP